MAKVCLSCGKALGFFDQKTRVYRRSRSLIGVACSDCHFAYSAFETELVASDVIESAPGAAPWMLSSTKGAINFRRDAPNAEALVRRTVETLSATLKRATPGTAELFSQCHTVYQCRGVLACSSPTEAIREIGTLMLARVALPGGDDEFSVSLHLSQNAMLLARRFGQGHKGSQVCYLLDSRHGVYEFYFWDR